MIEPEFLLGFGVQDSSDAGHTLQEPLDVGEAFAVSYVDVGHLVICDCKCFTRSWVE